MFQLSSLSKHRDDQDTKEANTFQFKNAIEARYLYQFSSWKSLSSLVHCLLAINNCCLQYGISCGIISLINYIYIYFANLNMCLFSYRLTDMKEITTELRRRIEAEENERRIANQQNQLK